MRQGFALVPLIETYFPAFVEDFYEEIDRHPEAQEGHPPRASAGRVVEGHIDHLVAGISVWPWRSRARVAQSVERGEDLRLLLPQHQAAQPGKTLQHL